MGNRIDLTGQRFGRLVVIEYAGSNNHKRAAWRCLCDCGNQKIVDSGNLRSGNSQSCGCLHNELLSERYTTHGETGSRLYWIWHGMKARCLNAKDKRYGDYGGRGIKVCDEWLSYEGFRDWAMANGYADNLTIDRLEVNGNYEPSNCRWATDVQQSNNKRNNRRITFNGKTQTIKQWADELGVKYNTLYFRIARSGWDVEKALTRWSEED
ncbi:MAG: hypothetical protein IIV14_00755 [Bacteroidaceae bacterium]|nr:hypothetical protein [Bacteroidaceae bacterium]